MLPTLDPFWLANAVSFVNQTLMFAFYVVGFVVALRRWKDRSRSVRFAVVGFGIGLLGDLGGMALMFGADWLTNSANNTLGGEPDFWPVVVASAMLSILAVASTTLILLALWFAWRDGDRAARGPVR